MTDNAADDPLSFKGSERIADALVGLLDGVADRGEAAAALVRGWVMIENALGPVVGRRGVVALYKRSLDLGSTAHPWLEDLRQTLPATIDLAALEAGVVGQSDPEAIAAGRRLLRAFCDLMVSLVGLSLAERLLRPVLLEIQDRPTGSLR